MKPTNESNRSNNRNFSHTKRTTANYQQGQSAMARLLQANAGSKPVIEEVPLGIPRTLRLIGDPNDQMPLLADIVQYGKRFKVDKDKIYTVRLGIHSDPNGYGAIPANSVGILAIPMEPAKEIQITALFSFEEIYPAVFGDSVILTSNHMMHLEYVHNSARLEPNNGLGGLNLGEDHVIRERNLLFICHRNLENELPQPNTTFTYDYITAQVKVKFDE